MNDLVRVKISNEYSNITQYLYRKNIDIYNIKYGEKFNIYLLNYSDLTKLKYIKYDVISYRGIKGILLKIKHNRIYFINLFIITVLMYLVSQIIIEVEVIHSNKDIRNIIKSELKIEGIRALSIKKDYGKIQNIKNEILNRHKTDIEWIEIIDNGMSYTVRVEERIIPKYDKEKEYCNVVSTKNATVLDIFSSKGQINVNENDFVNKDTVLISGDIRFREESKGYTCASGKVYGNTWYRVNISYPYDYEKRTYTKKHKKNLLFEYDENSYRLFNVHLNNYSTRKYRLFNLGKLRVYKLVHDEYKPTKYKYTDSEIMEKVTDIAVKKLKTNLGSDIQVIDKKVLQTDKYDSIINVDLFFSIKELISKNVELDIPKEEEGTDYNESTE